MTALSVTLPQFDTDIAPVLESAVAAEELGFDAVFLVDHLVPLGAPHRPVLELTASLGAVAAATRRIGVGTLVMRAPLRGPELSAAVAATAEALAPGRLTIGLGAGDRATFDEITRFGFEMLSLEQRLRMLEQAVDEIRSATAATRVWVGGRHERVREIAGRKADGWNRWAGSPEELTEELAGMQTGDDFVVSWGGTVILGSSDVEVEELLAGRRDRSGIVAGTPDVLGAALASWLDAGASHLILSLLPRGVETLQLFASEVRPRLPA